MSDVMVIEIGQKYIYISWTFWKFSWSINYQK